MQDRVYKKGIIGIKVGMSRAFTPSGESVAVTLIDASSCYVLEKKTLASHGYNAIKLGMITKKKQRANKSEIGYANALEVPLLSYHKEIRQGNSFENLYSDKQISIATFYKAGDFIDVTGLSIGKGFAGVVKKFHVKGQPATRGTHESRRNIGSVGCRKTPGRIFKNKIMPGRLGNTTKTIQNLQILSLIEDQNIIVVKGAIPGNCGGRLVIKDSTKKKNVISNL